MMTIGLINEVGVSLSWFGVVYGLIHLLFTGSTTIWFWLGLLGLIALVVVQAPVRFLKKDFTAVGDQTVLITGGSGGIGLALAASFAKRGYNILLVSRSAERLKEAAEKLKNRVPDFNKKIDFIESDLTDIAAPQKLFNEVNRRGYNIDILVNNAGVGLVKKIGETDAKQQADLLNLNVTSLTQLTSLFLPAMLAKKSGGILNVGSLAGFYPGPYMASYFASKSYVLNFTEALWWECMGTGVNVSILTPGPTESEFSKTSGSDKTALFNKNAVATAETVAEMGFKGLMYNMMVVVGDHPINAVHALNSGILPKLLTTSVGSFLNK